MLQGNEARREIEGLYQAYIDLVSPLERDSQFWTFHQEEMTAADFASKPMILVLGPYSTGKTTFIKNWLGNKEYTGAFIGPCMTTKQWVAVIKGDKDSQMHGFSAVADPCLPFDSVKEKLGDEFLKSFLVSKVANAKALDHMIFVDSPGILSQDQSKYDFLRSVTWFADRASMVLLMFDADKLDISEKLGEIIGHLNRNNKKLRIVLNKCDSMDLVGLSETKSALAYSIAQNTRGVVMKELPKIFVGSFRQEAYNPSVSDEQRKHLVEEEQRLYEDITRIPQEFIMGKADDLIARAHLAKKHAIIMDGLRRKAEESHGGCFGVCGKRTPQEVLLDNFEKVCFDIIKNSEHWPQNLETPDSRTSPGGAATGLECLNLDQMKVKLTQMDFKKFIPLDPSKMAALKQIESVTSKLVADAEAKIRDLKGIQPQRHSQNGV